MDPLRENPPAAERDLGAGQGQQRGVLIVTLHGTDVVTRCWAHKHEAEDDRWWVWVTSRWTEICVGRGCR